MLIQELILRKLNTAYICCSRKERTEDHKIDSPVLQINNNLDTEEKMSLKDLTLSKFMLNINSVKSRTYSRYQDSFPFKPLKRNVCAFTKEDLYPLFQVQPLGYTTYIKTRVLSQRNRVISRRKLVFSCHLNSQTKKQCIAIIKEGKLKENTLKPERYSQLRSSVSMTNFSFSEYDVKENENTENSELESLNDAGRDGFMDKELYYDCLDSRGFVSVVNTDCNKCMYESNSDSTIGSPQNSVFIVVPEETRLDLVSNSTDSIEGNARFVSFEKEAKLNLDRNSTVVAKGNTYFVASREKSKLDLGNISTITADGNTNVPEEETKSDSGNDNTITAEGTNVCQGEIKLDSGSLATITNAEYENDSEYEELISDLNVNKTTNDEENTVLVAAEEKTKLDSKLDCTIANKQDMFYECIDGGMEEITLSKGDSVTNKGNILEDNSVVYWLSNLILNQLLWVHTQGLLLKRSLLYFSDNMKILSQFLTKFSCT